jgi:hypothetical protein
MRHLLKIKCVDSRVNVHILASTSVPFALTTVQVPNLALTHTKRITVQWACEQSKQRSMTDDVQVFNIRNGEAALAFKTLPGSSINRLELGGALGTIR